MFGLASYTVEQRTKDIGVRKVLDAGVFNIWRLLTKDFVTLLQNYPYHTPITGWIFATAGLGAIALTLLTVSFQSIKAALTNPIDSLRTE